ncbi:MAG TPA: tRNA pseudouridine(55) synthase TruB [Ornithinimicrobium sp.]|uniref:tRNA pseudouridine(55) synthase TruB n=1 Tax=Ornithinimicrobium sp. TaxID=1977084 RepID=UPI002B476EB0|nr:tRNA pseudouridine(55) synthase TruB [Ornithinimicrobium sp.]HKJ11685.1 tRNA pseudouridine(55) synthase TruB [Ornithinimicrobium sp.]
MTGDGLLLIDKPSGWTSHDVVARCRRICGTRRVGHAGTLDPMATGLLVLGVGRATKLLTFLVGLDKTYTGTLRLGRSTLTDDADGEVTGGSPAGQVRMGEVLRAVRHLTGPIDQVPSAVSAIKVDGQRSYARVRAGNEVALSARPVTVHWFAVRRRREAAPVDAEVLDVDFTVRVSSGTYVRALARDLGQALGVGGHLTALRRTRVGDVDLGRALSIEKASASRDCGLRPMASVARALFPVRDLDHDQERSLRHGIPLPGVSRPSPGPVAGLGTDGDLVAMLEETTRRTRSRVVFPAR